MKEKIKVKTPPFELVIPLHGQKNIYLHLETRTRWIYDGEELKRDWFGEDEWRRMSNHSSINKTYQELFLEEYNFANSKL